MPPLLHSSIPKENLGPILKATAQTYADSKNDRYRPPPLPFGKLIV